MNDLTTLLDRAAGPHDPGPVDSHADLRRGRRALARSRRRRAGAGLLGVAAAGAVGVGAVRLGGADHPPDRGSVTAHDSGRTPSRGPGVTLLAQPLSAGPYTFDTTPEGWQVTGTRPQAVTISPVGGNVDPDPTVFTGKLVIMLDGNPPSGTQVTHDGRTFWVRGDSGYSTIETRTRPGEPDGMVSVQYPDDAGWDQETMLQFLAGVHVGAGAQAGVG